MRLVVVGVLHAVLVGLGGSAEQSALAAILNPAAARYREAWVVTYSGDAIDVTIYSGQNVRDLGSPHLKFVRRTGVLLCALAALGGATAGASPRSGPATYGQPRAWGGTEIQSLDPLRVRGGTVIQSLAPPRHSGSPSTGAGGSSKGAGGTSKGTSGSSNGAGHQDQVLSNETAFTRWAYVDRIAWIYAAPRTSSQRVGKLTWYTPDGFSSVYLVLRAHWDARGREWVKLRIPGRPNGRTGWVQGGALGSLHLTHDLVVVNREQRQMYFYSRGHQIWSAPVGVGKPGTPTPTGHFWIDERFKVTDPGSGYYPYAFGTTDYSTLSGWPGGGVVGIHGPYYDPQGIPGYISHGCIRLHVSDDFWLAARLQLGTPLHVI